MEIMDYVLRTHKNARKEMNEMGGKVLETYTEKTEKRARKEIHAAAKDIRNGLSSVELKKKYSAETIRVAKSIAQLFT